VFRRSIGCVPQDLLLLPDRGVLANVMLPAHAAGLTRAECESRARAALERVGADAGMIADLRPQSLSGGEQQRVALARAVVNRPALLLVDEPTAHLDTAAADTLIELLDHFAASGVTVLLASHDDSRDLPARARRLRLDRGKAVA
jgi:cell division transport system ATP-binding protein